MKIKNDEGQEVEVYTQEDLEKASTEAIDKYKEENSEDLKQNQEELEGLKSDLDEANEKIEELELLNDGEDNEKKEEARKNQIKRLKESKEKAEKKLEEKEGKIKDDIDSLRNELIADVKSDLLDKYSAGDKEKRKEIEFEFENYKSDKTSKKDIKERMEVAFKIVTGQEPTPSVLSGLSNASARGDGSNKDGGQPATENEKAIGNALSITDEDRKKYNK